MNARVRRGLLISKDKGGVLLSLRLQGSYSQPHSIGKFSIYTYKLFDDPIVFVLNPGLLTRKKKEYVSNKCF